MPRRGLEMREVSKDEGRESTEQLANTVKVLSAN